MTTELQSNVLSASTIRKALPSCMVYALVQSVTFMVDTIVAGHFLGSDAVAAVALGIPIIGLMISFAGMILQRLRFFTAIYLYAIQFAREECMI
jgi:Na+-driven multidrug efflux pump